VFLLNIARHIEQFVCCGDLTSSVESVCLVCDTVINLTSCLGLQAARQKEDASLNIM